MQIKKILLMAPPVFTLKYYRDISPFPPLGLGYLAAVIENMGIQAKIVDFLARGWNNEKEIGQDLIRIGSSDSDIADYLDEFSPDLVGISCQFSRQNKIYQEMFSLIKRVKPDCVTVAGGAHVTVCPQQLLANSACNYILLGEAESSFQDLISGLVRNEDIYYIDGLGWKSKGKTYINNKKEWVSDLDTIPFPAYHLMEMETYFGISKSHGDRHKRRFYPIITSRGCPAKCTFCSAKKVWGERYRVRSVSNVLNEMRKLKNEYNIEELMFEDDNVTANPIRAKELFSNMISEKFNFVWDTPNGVGVWSIDEEMLDLIKESGCIKLNFPIESGSQEVIDKIINKPIKLLRVKSLIEYCKKIKLDFGIFLVIGMPGEKIKDMWKSLRFAADCGCFTPHISIATPYPGTELFEQCLKNNYFVREFSLNDLFIRSFMIKTPEWNEGKLRRMLFLGEHYLKMRQFFSDPIGFLKIFFSYIANPVSLINYFRKYTYSQNAFKTMMSKNES